MCAGLRALATGVDIEIWSDVVCPWCYIGKTRLDKAIADFPGEVTLTWRAFQLDPGATSDGKPLVDSLAQKFGGRDRTRQVLAHTTGVGTEEGLDLRFADAVSSNTFDAHRLIWFAGTQGRQAETVAALHEAHFTRGLDIGSRAVLAQVASEVGLDAADFLASEAGAAEVTAELTDAAELGITSVPTFVIDGKYAVTGAQSTDVLRQVLDEVARLATASA